MVARLVPYQCVARGEVVDALHAANELDDAFVESSGASTIMSNVARACVPLLGHVVFFDLCERGELVERAAAAWSTTHPELGAAIEVHAADRTWRTCVEHIVMTKRVVFDPASTLAWGIRAGALSTLVEPLRANGKVVGVIGAVREGRAHSLAEVRLARQIAYRVARAIDTRR